MKTIYIVDESDYSVKNGIGTYIKEIINSLQSIDVKISIISFDSNIKYFNIFKKNNIEYICFPRFNNYTNNYARIINKFLRIYIADNINNIFWYNYTPFSSLMLMLKHSHPLSRQIYVVHDLGWTSKLLGDKQLFIDILKKKEDEYTQKKFVNIFFSYNEEKWMTELADDIICLSEDAYSILLEHYQVDPMKLHLVNNALKHTQITWTTNKKKAFKDKMMLNPDYKIILFIAGGLYKAKGIYEYIKAFRQILKHTPNCYLVIVGDLHNINTIIKDCYPIMSKLLFTGFIPKKELEKWYQIANIGVIPSYTEQCSYVGLEMMSHHIPIVSTDGLGIRNMFHNDFNAQIAIIGDRLKESIFIDNLAKASLNLLKSDNLCKICKMNASLILSQKYCFNNILNQYKEILDHTPEKKISQS